MALPIIQLLGNLKRTELRYIPSGKALYKFQLECSEKNSKGEWDNLYISGELWDKQAEFANQYFKDGSVALVTGKLVTSSYEKQDGTKVYENKLLFPSISFVPKDKSEQQSQQPRQEPPIEYERQSVPEIDIDEDEIPFSEVTAPIHNADKFYVKCITCKNIFDTDKYDLDLEDDGDICGFCPICKSNKIFFKTNDKGVLK